MARLVNITPISLGLVGYTLPNTQMAQDFQPIHSILTQVLGAIAPGGVTVNFLKGRFTKQKSDEVSLLGYVPKVVDFQAVSLNNVCL